MKIKATVTLTATIDTDDYREANGEPMKPEAIIAEVKEEIEEDWESAQSNYDLELDKVSVEVVKEE